MNFLHIGYHDQVVWAADVCKIKVGYVPNLSNYGNFFINLECFDISKNWSILFIYVFGTVISTMIKNDKK